VSPEQVGDHVESGLVNEAQPLSVAVEQRLNFSSKRVVAKALPIEECRALDGTFLDGGLK
jgi:hypothetical protein